MDGRHTETCILAVKNLVIVDRSLAMGRVLKRPGFADNGSALGGVLKSKQTRDHGLEDFLIYRCRYQYCK